MTVVLDTTVLLYFLNPATSAPLDPATGVPLADCPERVNLLIANLSKARERIIIPAPVIAEVLTRAMAAAPGYLAAMDRERAFVIAPFDTLAAIEAAEIRAKVLGPLRSAFVNVPRAKLKFDTLIAATAIVHGATCIYSDDGDLKTLGKHLNMEVKGVRDLPQPPRDLFGPVTRRISLVP